MIQTVEYYMCRKLGRISLQKRVDTFQAFVDCIWRIFDRLRWKLTPAIYERRVDEFDDFSLDIENGLLNVTYGLRLGDTTGAMTTPSFLTVGVLK